MGERYYLTGVQLGMLMAFAQLGKIDEINKILEEIEQKQQIVTEHL